MALAQGMNKALNLKHQAVAQNQSLNDQSIPLKHIGTQQMRLSPVNLAAVSRKKKPTDMTTEDARVILAAGSHLGSTNCNFQMEPYVYSRRPDGIHIINIGKMWSKMQLAALAIAAALEQQQEVVAISCRPWAQRAVLKFAKYTGAVALAGRYTPGTFTNQAEKSFREPALLVVGDPTADHQPVTESSYSNIPIVAFCDSDTPLRYVDIAIPCNNKGRNSIGLTWWLLTREVLRLRGLIPRGVAWDVMVDLFIVPPEVEKTDEVAEEVPDFARDRTALQENAIQVDRILDDLQKVDLEDVGYSGAPLAFASPVALDVISGQQAVPLPQPFNVGDWGAESEREHWTAAI
ncbi:40S ribosomal protein SA [Halotydeus destructor]|nr:40S ribosomal protein SA [Halotydeus destructor]